jgi:sulfate adenylyltransferase subunit 2
MDVWQYIERENLEVPSIYFAHERDVFRRDNMWLATSEFLPNGPDEAVLRKVVRYRTVGDMTCTGAVDSPAANVSDIILEVAAARITERGATRADDAFSETSMEDRKREGYF